MENHPMFQVFSEIKFHNSRLAVLGIEAKKVLDIMKSDGMDGEVLEEFYEVARKAAGVDHKTSKDNKGKQSRRCKWWNRGFCREKENCSFIHEIEDCQEHLKGGCTNKECKTLRHRKCCKYFNSEEGCYRGSNCQYLHVIITKEKENKKSTDGKAVIDKEVQTIDTDEVKEKDVQTDIEIIVSVRRSVTAIRYTLKKIKLFVYSKELSAVLTNGKNMKKK